VQRTEEIISRYSETEKKPGRRAESICDVRPLKGHLNSKTNGIAKAMPGYKTQEAKS
jgi:hypothetical protein